MVIQKRIILHNTSTSTLRIALNVSLSKRSDLQRANIVGTTTNVHWNSTLKLINHVHAF